MLGRLINKLLGPSMTTADYWGKQKDTWKVWLETEKLQIVEKPTYKIAYRFAFYRACYIGNLEIKVMGNNIILRKF
jgi:hypothetical protein